MPTSSLPDTFAPSDGLNAPALRRLLGIALPDKSRRKAAAWWGQTDFVLTRSHVDEDGDAFHDGLLITVWKRWDFWLALPGTAPVQPGNWATPAWARLRGTRSAVCDDGLLRQFRIWDAQGHPGAWQPLQDAPTAAHDALARAWRDVQHYWQAADTERRAGWPLRAQLHRAVTAQRVAALVALPLFTLRYNDWGDPERAGCWQGDLWAGARQSGASPAGRHTAALKLSWRNGEEAPGDAEDDAHACYQIELLDAQAPPAPGAVHPSGLALSYSQRQSDPRVALPGDAALHVAQLIGLFTRAEQRLLAADAREREQTLHPGASAAAPALAQLPPYAPGTGDAEALGPAVLALSRDWQAAARAHATALLAHWADADAAAPPPHDARERWAPAVLQLARAVHALDDADLAERFHHRFAFAPGAYAAHAARHGQPVQALRWLPDGRLLAWVGGGQDVACWQIDLEGLHPQPAHVDSGNPPGPATVHGTTVCGDARGDLHGRSEDGRPLWRHRVGGPVLCVANSHHAGEPLLAVGTQTGCLVLLKKGTGPDALLPSTSRYHELRRILFWDDARAPLAW